MLSLKMKKFTILKKKIMVQNIVRKLVNRRRRVLAYLYIATQGQVFILCCKRFLFSIHNRTSHGIYRKAKYRISDIAECPISLDNIRGSLQLL